MITLLVGISSGWAKSGGDLELNRPAVGVKSAAEAELTSPRERPANSMGPLQVLSVNPRYFTDGTGKAVLLSGFEFWDILRFDGTPDVNARSWGDFLNISRSHGTNFVRFWTWNELTKFRSKPTFPWFTSKEIWMRSGPGTALDGRPRFDLDRHNLAYFDELRERVTQAREKGLYISIMLFEGWSLRYMESPWRWDGHPFNVKNNIQGINGDPDGNGEGIEIHTLAIPEVTQYQEEYVKTVIDSVNEFDNVLYEISNEDHAGSTEWQYHMIRFIQDYERTNKPQQHPVWMSVQFRKGDPGTTFNQNLFNSPADAISPNKQGGYRENPPASDGRKVIIADTDHLCGCILDHGWVWKSFTRGLNVVNYMELPQLGDADPKHVSARNAMGHILQFANKVDLASMSPHGDVSSTNYALVKPGSEYVVYVPAAGHLGMGQLDRMGLHGRKSVNWFTRHMGWNETVEIDLSGSPETFRVEWFNPRTGETLDGGVVEGGGDRSFTAPITGDAVLYLYRSKGSTPD